MLKAAWEVSNKRDALKTLSMAKLFASGSLYHQGSKQWHAIMGGYGYIMEYDMQRHFREARSTTIAAGTSQMQRNIIAHASNGIKATMNPTAWARCHVHRLTKIRCGRCHDAG